MPKGELTKKGCASVALRPPAVGYRTCPMPTLPCKESMDFLSKMLATRPLSFFSMNRCPSKVTMPGGVLTAVLKHEKTLVQLGGGGAVLAKDADDAAHPSGLPARREVEGDQLGGGGVGRRRSTGGKPRRRGRRWLTGSRRADVLNRDAAIDVDGRAKRSTDSICETYLERSRTSGNVGEGASDARRQKATRWPPEGRPPSSRG